MMKISTLNHGLALILALGLSACFEVSDSNQVDPQKIYQYYRTDFDEETSEFYNSATFYKGSPGGDSIDLQAPSQVTLDGRSMQKKSFLTLHYELRSREGFGATHQWNYTDDSGKTYTNPAQVVPIHIASLPSTISKSVGFPAQFGGEALAKNDTLQLTGSYSIADGSARFVHIDPIGSVGNNSFSVRAEQLTEIPVGSVVTFKLVRIRTAPLQRGTGAGGEIRTQYTSRSSQSRVAE